MESNLFHLQYAIDTFYFLVCGALVMWMAAGFAMLESGLVRAKNTTEILTKNVALFAVACTMYLVCGYAIMYGGNVFLSGIADVDVDGVLGDFATREDGFTGGSIYSAASDFFFQVVFVATAMSIVSGAVAERMKLWAFLVFAVFMTGFIYPLEGAWTWGGADVFGMYNLGDLGFSDFAGSGIVHMAGAAAALAGVLLLGPRKGKYGPNGEIRAFPGANMPLAALGTFILWMGWFGFNGGSELAADGVAGMAVLVTHLATATAALTWMLIEWFNHGKPSVLGIITGAVAGLVAITPASGTAGPLGAVLIGFCSAAVCYYSATKLKKKLGYDDSLDVFGVHGVGGIIGAILTGLCAATFMGGIGLEEGVGAGAQVWAQTLSVIVTILWSGVVSFVVLKLVDLTIGLRVSEDVEVAGLDLHLHDEQGYEI